MLGQIAQTIKQKTIMSGASDIIVIKWNNGQYKCTPFLICFGKVSEYYILRVKIEVNDKLIQNQLLQVNKNGYLQPAIPSQKLLKLMNLRYGPNNIKFHLFKIKDQIIKTIKCQIHCYSQYQKLIISDVDGTLTKSDIAGLVCNLIGKNHIHNGYIQLIQKAQIHGYKIVWLTMRSINLYSFSKAYIKFHTKISGALFTQPQQFYQATKKQLKKQTVQAKLHMLKKIRDIFPPHINPFAGGLGNRINDAYAYAAAKIPPEKIFLVDSLSVVKRWGDHQKIDYQHIHTNIQTFFPKIDFAQLLKQSIDDQNSSQQAFLKESLLMNRKIVLSKSTNDSNSINLDFLDLQRQFIEIDFQKQFLDNEINQHSVKSQKFDYNTKENQIDFQKQFLSGQFSQIDINKQSLPHQDNQDNFQKYFLEEGEALSKKDQSYSIRNNRKGMRAGYQEDE